MKRDVDNLPRVLKARKVSYVVPKFHELLVHKRLKTGPEFYPPSLSPFVPVHRTHSASLTWRPTATLDETALGSFAAQI